MTATLIPLHGAMGFGFGPGPFFAFLGVLLLAFLASRLFRTGRLGPIRYDGRAGSAGRRPRTAEDDALATLKSRLAAGDITVEEYLERSSVLRKPTTDV